MTRRILFGKLLGAAAVCFAPFAARRASAGIPVVMPDNYFKKGALFPTGPRDFLDGVNRTLLYEADHSGFHFFFTGYKAAWDSSVLVGQALAWPHNRDSERYYEACTGGGSGARYKAGDVFDISGADHLHMDDFGPRGPGLEKARRLRDEAFKTLLKVMREHGEAV